MIVFKICKIYWSINNFIQSMFNLLKFLKKNNRLKEEPELMILLEVWALFSLIKKELYSLFAYVNFWLFIGVVNILANNPKVIS